MTDPLPARRLLLVHAHPDDECMSTGGVLVRYAREGLRTVLVTATRGEEGEVVDPEMNPEEVKPKLITVKSKSMPPQFAMAQS